MVCETKGLNLQFYLISINFNLNSHMWLVAVVWDSAVLKPS